MAKQILPTFERASELLRYDPTTGILIWKVRSGEGGSIKAWNARYSQTEAFTSLNAYGYKNGSIDGTSVYAHRVAWLLATGNWPKEQIDHINGNKTDNRLANLREASNAENMRNKGPRADNKCGLKGVHWNPQNKRWKAQISLNGKIKYLGLFGSAEEAHAAYCKAAAHMHEEFARFA